MQQHSANDNNVDSLEEEQLEDDWSGSANDESIGCKTIEDKYNSEEDKTIE